MEILIIILLMILCVIFIFKYYNKKSKTYTKESFTILVKDLENPPEWLSDYAKMCVMRTVTTIHHDNYLDVSSKLTLNLYYDGEI